MKIQKLLVKGLYFLSESFLGLNMFSAFFFVLDAGLTALTHLDLFGARITDSGTNYLKCMSDIPISHVSS